MELQDFYFIAEIIAAFAVVGSLIFVGVQMRQNTGALRASVSSEMMTNWVSVLAPMTNCTEFVDAAVKFFGAQRPDELPQEAQTRLIAFWSTGMKNAEFSYYRFLAGEMDEGLWTGVKNGALQPFQFPPMREAIWPAIRVQCSPQFVSYIETSVKNGDHLKLEEAYGAPAYAPAQVA